MKTYLFVFVVWLTFLLNGFVNADGYSARSIMEDMLDSYSYMSYAQHEEPFNFHKRKGYERQRIFSCEKLGSMTKKGTISDNMCMRVFLYYWGL